MGYRQTTTVILAVLGAVGGNAFEFKTGDLLFEASGDSEFSNAITEATAGADGVSYVHVGMAVVDVDGNTSVIEADPDKGVRIISVEEFLNNSVKIGDRPGVTVKRLQKEFPAEQAAERAMSHLGEPYDWWYLPGNGKMYCSELIYETFLTENGEHIFTAAPMNFRWPDGTIGEFWTKLYDELGVDVPEGLPGTNPNGMSKDPVLTEVYRYF